MCSKSLGILQFVSKPHWNCDDVREDAGAACWNKSHHGNTKQEKASLLSNKTSPEYIPTVIISYSGSCRHFGSAPLKSLIWIYYRVSRLVRLNNCRHSLSLRVSELILISSFYFQFSRLIFRVLQKHIEYNEVMDQIESLITVLLNVTYRKTVTTDKTIRNS